MSVLKLPLLVDLQQKVGELVISITSCPSIIILENTLNQFIKKIVDHQYNVSRIHMLEFWVWEF
jgi:hypothetical protein